MAMKAIDRCVPQQQRSIDAAYASRRRASILDLVMLQLEGATETQRRMIDLTFPSDGSHSQPYPPVNAVTDAMCRRLWAGRSIEPLSFWLLFCSSGTPIVADLLDRSNQIDALLAERRLHE
jgi:hypothetical protein